MSTIFCQRQGSNEPAEAYCRIFESAISMSELEKCNATTHMELNKSYANVDDEDGTKRLQEIFLIVSAEHTNNQGSGMT